MNKDKLKKILLIVLTSCGVLVVASGSYAWKVFTSAITNIQEEVDDQQTQKRLASINLKEGDPITILLMGIDDPGGPEDPNRRADSLILVTLNPKKQTTHIVSIPRDTYVPIANYGKKDKINASYAYGGTKMTINTVESLIGVPVDYFIRADKRGLVDLVDAIGGIKVDNAFEFKYKGFTYEKGPIDMHGEKALHYARMRKQDPRGDFGRQERQRQVLQEIADKARTVPGITTSISNFRDIIRAIEDNVRTNLGLEEMWDIQKNYQAALNHVEEHEIVGTEGEKNKTYYYFPDEEKIKELSDELNNHLEK
ncbi:LytR family transcriptional regulator [Bacillus timonensis]|uniref:LytR family transcriptional regulator n=1 Tax=Bacillus timonensis TaxID=1033734 RepID=A0A4V3V7G3_9BACI|nr:LCP family protein [Bacillus timonensis]THE11033.1 LytR family transcriptional regulator [Bacillus timonensis]